MEGSNSEDGVPTLAELRDFIKTQDQMQQAEAAEREAELLQMQLVMKPGCVVQVDPGVSGFGGCLLMVSDVKKWGVVGFIPLPSSFNQQNRIYFRARWDQIGLLAIADWIPDDLLMEDEEPPVYNPPTEEEIRGNG